jgi:hypothetical protein
MRYKRTKKRKRDVGQTKQGWYQGWFEVQNPQKYKGKKKPFYRSGLERKLMKTLDTSDWCLEWLSEQPQVKYVNPLTKTPQNPAGNVWNYHPDFVVVVDNGDGTTSTKMIEVKPQKQTKPPKPSGRGRSRRLVESETRTWVLNQAKWDAAKDYCKKRGWEFIIMTEKDIK